MDKHDLTDSSILPGATDQGWLVLRATMNVEPAGLTSCAVLVGALVPLAWWLGMDTDAYYFVFLPLAAVLLLVGGIGTTVQHWAKLKYGWSDEELQIRVYSSPGYYLVHTSGIVLIVSLVLTLRLLTPLGGSPEWMAIFLCGALGLGGLMAWARWIALPRLRREVGA